jgi:nicotinamide-nucleotide adenylyltransferase
LKFVSKIKIGVGSSQFSDQLKNPFSYQEREQFIKNSLMDENLTPSRYEIYPIPDQFDMKIWLDKIPSIVGHFDIIFTNSLWIGRLFQQKNKDMIYGLIFDLERFNGTKIRDFIFSNQPEWLELVPDYVKNYINQPNVSNRMKKLGISGK